MSFWLLRYSIWWHQFAKLRKSISQRVSQAHEIFTQYSYNTLASPGFHSYNYQISGFMNLLRKIRIEKKNENGGWLELPFLCHSCTPGGSSVMSVFIWRGCRSPMNFTTMASIKIPAITPKRNILLRVHVLLTKTTMTHVSFLITFLSYLNVSVSRNYKMTLI